MRGVEVSRDRCVSPLDSAWLARFTSLMTTTQTAPLADYAAIVATWTDEMIANSRTMHTPRDEKGNMRELTEAQEAFCKAVNAEWRRRFNR